MVQPIMQTLGWGIWLDGHPPCPQSNYSLLKAASGNGIDCAIYRIARNSTRSIRNPPSSSKLSVEKYRIWCSSGTGMSNNDNNDNNLIIWDDKDGKEEDAYLPVSESYDDDYMDDDGSGIEIQVEKIANNRRRIRSRVSIQASLQTVWNILTDYERLADFIPGLVVSQLLEKRDNFARLLQIGQQNLAFGLKFKAKGIIDCYEKEIQDFPFGQRRDIEFKMIEGDFQLFEGKWSIEQSSTGKYNLSDSVVGQGFCTTLFYVVEVEPKVWLPVRLVQGRLCREIKMNLSCIQKVAERASHKTGSGH